jgi:hypothetical protein
MSSTNRSNARDTHVSDYYVTPHKPIRDVLNALAQEEHCDIGSDLFEDYSVLERRKIKKGIRFLDPCAGGDQHNQMSYPSVLKEYGVNPNKIDTIDIREDSKALFKLNFLNADFSYLFTPDVIITNPPFNIAQDIIQKALSELPLGGYGIFLLRLNFFDSKKRKEFWQSNMPILTFVHRDRISFTNGQADSVEYMHCVWKKGVKQNHTKLIIV